MLDAGTDAAQAGKGLGAYGLRIAGLDGATEFLSAVPALSPTLHIVRSGGISDAEHCLTDQLAVLALSGDQGIVRLERDSLTATFALKDEHPDEAILHPFMSGSAAITNWWLGRDTFHAGAFLSDEGAWALIGDKGQGKSSTLGYLASQGIPILTDDLLITEDGEALAGPAFVDLRPDAAERLQTGRDMGLLGARSRFRITVPTPPSRVPLLGWIVLGWGEDIELVEIPVADRLRWLFANRAVWRRPPNPATFLAHAALPMWELRRPQSWSSFPNVLDLIDTRLLNRSVRS